MPPSRATSQYCDPFPSAAMSNTGRGAPEAARDARIPIHTAARPCRVGDELAARRRASIQSRATQAQPLPAALSARIPLCESSESAAGPRAKRNVGEDDDNYQKSKPSHSHHTGVRNRSRSLRFDPGQCGNGDYGDYEAEPCEPVHDSDFRKIRASRPRGIIERLPGAEAFRARACLIQWIPRRPRTTEQVSS